MVRVIGLAAAVAACWACAPAQAGVLGVELPEASVPAASAPAAEPVVRTVTPAVEQVAKSLPAVETPADQTIQHVKTVAQPAVDAAVETTASTARVVQGRAGDSGGLRVGASSLRRAPSARLRHTAPEAPAPARTARAERPQQGRPGAVTQAAAPRSVSAAQPAATAPDRGTHQAPPHHSSGADGGISAGAAFAGGLAVLAAALMLMAPRLRRRLSIDTAVLRPVAFVALLERPG